MLKLLTAWNEKTKIGILLLLAGVPSLIGNGTLRAAAAVLCCGAALFLVSIVLRKYHESLEEAHAREHEREVDALREVIGPLISHLSSNVQITPVLTNQLKEVTRQTEQATLDMCEKFMAIANRARKQAENAAEAVMGPITQKTEKSAAESRSQSPDTGRSVEEALAALDGMMLGAKNKLETLKTENEALARDISGIIISMQFQDITRQRIDRVIERLAKFQQETEDLLERLRSMNERISGSGGNGRADRLEQMYTMESERATMKKTLLALNEK